MTRAKVERKPTTCKTKPDIVSPRGATPHDNIPIISHATDGLDSKAFVAHFADATVERGDKHVPCGYKNSAPIE